MNLHKVNLLEILVNLPVLLTVKGLLTKVNRWMEGAS